MNGRRTIKSYQIKVKPDDRRESVAKSEHSDQCAPMLEFPARQNAIQEQKGKAANDSYGIGKRETVDVQVTLVRELKNA
jgi:hypothetical protein